MLPAQLRVLRSLSRSKRHISGALRCRLLLFPSKRQQLTAAPRKGVLAAVTRIVIDVHVRMPRQH